jgi:hypothetical protein
MSTHRVHFKRLSWTLFRAREIEAAPVRRLKTRL